MRRLLLPLAIASLLPLTAAAQRVSESNEAESAPRIVLLDSLLGQDLGERTAGSTPRVVPLWTSPDGRILTAVALDSDSNVYLAPVSPQVSSALDWRLVDASALLAGELRLDGGNRLRASVGVTEQSLLGLDTSHLDASCLGVPNWLSSASANCLSAPLGESLRWRSSEVSAGWTSGPLTLDLAYGFSWLKGNQGSLSTAAGALGSSVLPLFGAGASLPTLVLPNAALGQLESSSQLGARGRWDLGPNSGIDLGASIARLRLLPDADGARGNYNQTALSLGLDRGAFSGNITGRLLSPQQPVVGAPQRWTSIDLGVTWRTPWQGELSIGAQSMWATPPAARDDAETQARVPYVQYHQDL